MKKEKPRNAMIVLDDEKDPNSQGMWIYKGLPIIAKKNDKDKYDILNNEIFMVKYVDTKTKKVHITDDENEKIIPLNVFNKYFYPAYCVTVHKMQGSTVNEPLSIFEWSRMSEKMKYTAVTRVTKKEYLNVFY